jgi:hypothetical protein
MVVAGSERIFRIISAALGRLGGGTAVRNAGEGSVAAKLWIVAIVPCAAAIYRKFLSKIHFVQLARGHFPVANFSLAVVRLQLGDDGRYGLPLLAQLASR